jgi:hypothetical protein
MPMPGKSNCSFDFTNMLRKTRARYWRSFPNIRPTPLPPGYASCVRVYGNGEWVFEPRRYEEVEEWVAHNAKHRFGEALFVDGECRRGGYLQPADVTAIVVRLNQGRDPTGYVERRDRGEPVPSREGYDD